MSTLRLIEVLRKGKLLTVDLIESLAHLTQSGDWIKMSTPCPKTRYRDSLNGRIHHMTFTAINKAFIAR